MTSHKVNSSMACRPFYVSGTKTPIASDLIRESRQWLQSVSTNRPFTPIQNARCLFKKGDTLLSPRQSSTPSRSSNEMTSARQSSFLKNSKSQMTEESKARNRASQIQLIGTRISPNTLRGVLKNDTAFLLHSSGCSIRTANTNRSLIRPTIRGPVSTTTVNSDKSQFLSVLSANKRSKQTPLASLLSPSRDVTNNKLSSLFYSRSQDIVQISDNVILNKEASNPKQDTNELDQTISEFSKLVGMTEASTEAMFNPSKQWDKLGAERYEDARNLCVIQRANDVKMAIIHTGWLYEDEFPGRSTFLCALFEILKEKSSAELQIFLAHLALTLRVSGRNLVHITRRIYTIAKDHENDRLFIKYFDLLKALFHLIGETRVIDVRTNSGTTKKLTTPIDALLYACGSLKFLFASSVTQSKITNIQYVANIVKLHHELVQLAVYLNKTPSTENGKSTKSINPFHVLAQIMEILCQLESQPLAWQIILVPAEAMKVVLSGLQQCSTVTISSTQRVVLLNWIRFLGLMTEHSKLCHYLVDNHQQAGQEVCHMLVGLIFKFRKEAEFVVRLAYLLGNLTARNVMSRNSSIPSLQILQAYIRIFAHYTEQFLNKIYCSTDNFQDLTDDGAHQNDSPADYEPAMLYDVLVKLSRLLANTTIAVGPGTIAASSSECIFALLNTLDKITVQDEELIVNTLAALNNITFHMDPDPNADAIEMQISIGKALLRLIWRYYGRENVILGAFRIIGNLTRSQQLRCLFLLEGDDAIMSSYEQVIGEQFEQTSTDSLHFLHILMEHLDSENFELVYSTLGVLINLMTDSSQQSILQETDCCQKVLEIARKHAGHDWLLTALTCKFLWNYLETQQCDTGELFDVHFKHELIILLSEYTDKEMVQCLHKAQLEKLCLEEIDEGSIGSAENFWESTWSSEFLPVAQRLLGRLVNP